MKKKYFDFKEYESYADEMTGIEPLLGIIYYAFVAYANEHNLPVVKITRVFKAVPGETGIHQDGRAIDCSSKNWSQFHINRVQKKLNMRFDGWGTGPTEAWPDKTKVIIHHKIPGGAYHFHLQIRRGLKLFKEE